MKIRSLVIITSVILLIGCQSSKIIFPGCGIDKTHMNNEIRSGLMDEWNSYKKWDGVIFFVQSKYKSPITFPIDLNLQVFVYDPDDQEWLQTTNQTIIPGGEEQEILEKENDATTRSISLDLPNSPETVKVFYCVSGATADGILVGASGSFDLNPE
jgi:uncharacterized protein YcfL